MRKLKAHKVALATAITFTLAGCSKPYFKIYESPAYGTNIATAHILDGPAIWEIGSDKMMSDRQLINNLTKQMNVNIPVGNTVYIRAYSWSNFRTAYKGYNYRVCENIASFTAISGRQYQFSQTNSDEGCVIDVKDAETSETEATLTHHDPAGSAPRLIRTH